MKTIQLNSHDIESQSEHLAELLIEQGYGGSIVATAVNGEFVPQGNRANTQLQNGDRVEVLAPMQGG
ncbi:sulfur carrier protein ThiS [Paraglaciecola sp. 2405UD69-4]|uniref:sulfur carrier protein ThiS n=1 Tax=Paraglaciecola sp. 2405UD69-4 TaxID=3391836 RepID=UPI0039C8CD6C